MAEVDDIINEPSEAEKRIKGLSDKVRTASEERDAALKAKAEAEEEAKAAQRKAEFAEGFADIVAENPDAKEFKADIEAKVMGGMTLDDAKFAVLGKAGKLGAPQAVTPAGGSAPTVLPSEQKDVKSMNGDELRQQLIDRNDELVSILSPKVG